MSHFNKQFAAKKTNVRIKARLALSWAELSWAGREREIERKEGGGGDVCVCSSRETNLTSKEGNPNSYLFHIPTDRTSHKIPTKWMPGMKCEGDEGNETERNGMNSWKNRIHSEKNCVWELFREWMEKDVTYENTEYEVHKMNNVSQSSSKT